MTFRGTTLIDFPLGGETRFVPDNGGGRPEKGRSGLRGTALLPPFQLPAAFFEPARIVRCSHRCPSIIVNSRIFCQARRREKFAFPGGVLPGGAEEMAIYGGCVDFWRKPVING